MPCWPSRATQRRNATPDGTAEKLQGARHGGIKFVTPQQRHSSHAVEICRQRAHVYEKARQKHPRRWSRSTRCWRKPEVVWINKPPEEPMTTPGVPLPQAA